MSKKLVSVTEKPNRNERILKRRELSQARSLAMHKARLSAGNKREQTGNVSHHKLNVGCSGWFYWHWRGKFYPADLPTGKWFEHYSKNFDTVELNAPFYNWPTLNTVKTWLRQIKNKDFYYTVKVSEIITHVKKFQATKTLVKDFQFIADILGPAMGCFLFQLPPSFKYTYSRLINIVRQLDPELKNVIEFRHESWWNETVYKKFRDNNIIFCACSSPKLPEDLIKTADDIYIRFHGKAKMYRYDYSTAELQEWVKKIKKSKAQTIWVYFNNDFQGNAIKNAKEFINLLNSELPR